MRSYSVLDPVSQAYPKVQGRSPTCYSPVRHSSTPKGLSVRLACVKHAASVRPEPGSNSPNKNPHTHRRRQNSNQKNPITKTRNIWQKNSHAPKRENADTTKNNKQKPPNTLLSSQTTPPFSGNPATVLHVTKAVKLRPQVFRPWPWASDGNTTCCRP